MSVSATRMLLAGGFLYALLYVPSPSHSTSWVAPRRPLTTAEKLELSATEADAIIAGRVIALVDTLILSKHNRRIYERYQYLEFEPEQWLKGHGTQHRLRASFPYPDSPTFSRLRWPGSTPENVLLFLGRLPPLPKNPGPLVRRMPGVEWVIRDTPYDFESGIALIGGGREDSLRVAIATSIANRSLPALARRADAIVRGIVLPGTTPCRCFDREDACVPVKVEEWLKGSERSDVIQTYTLLRDDIPIGGALLFLRKTPEGSFEVLSFRAGAMQIKDQRVLEVNAPLDAVLAQVREALRGGPRP